MKDIYHDNKNDIDPTALIGPDVTIGKCNVIGAFTVIKGRVIIGDNNYIAPFVCIGEPPEYRGKAANGIIKIGSGNRISEFVAVQLPALSGITSIGDDNYIMDKCHVAHDCHVGNEVNIAPLTSLGGSVTVEDFANLGQKVVIHPRLTIGRGAMVGMGAVVTKNIPEFETWAGNPARFMKMNQKAIDKHGQKQYKHGR